MKEKRFNEEVALLFEHYQRLIDTKNELENTSNGIFSRYKRPILTAAHVPPFWKYDLDYQTNPMLMERMGINAVFNAGAIRLNGKVLLVVRMEGADRKSFFAVAESANGVDQFWFWDYPVTMPETSDPDTNVYDMRVVQHEDGWIYGLFCTERKDPGSLPSDTSSAIAQCGIARTRDLKTWERLEDLKTYTGQQRNVVLHPEFVQGKYAFYTRPQQGFIDVGSGGGIGWGLSDGIERAEIREEIIIDDRIYHTIKEVKNGLGPAPIKTDHGWLHLAHGVRNTAAGLRYVLYVFMTALESPWKVIHRPGGHFLAPEGMERVGDVSNVVFSNGWVADEAGRVFIYYASSDTRLHVATTSIERLLDYTMHTPEDGLTSANSVRQRMALIKHNLNKSYNATS